MQHERAIFDKLSEARGALANAKSVAQRAEAESMLGRALGGVFAVAESYPDLKADQGFRSLQQRISEIENQIADRREFYNDVVTLYNTRLEQIPDSWVAQGMQLQSAELFKIADRDREDPVIEFRMTA
jgi:LemA protein